MTALNCLVRNATTYVIRWRAAPHDQGADRPADPPAVRGPARHDHRVPTVGTRTVVHQPAPDTSKALDDVAASFPVTKKGQIDFGF